MIKTVIVIGNEYYINGTLHFSIKHMDLYVVYASDIIGSREAAQTLLYKNNVLFFQSLKSLKVTPGTYVLGDHGITICNDRCSISAYVETHRALWSVIKIKLPFFTSEFKIKILWNNILHYLSYISIGTILLWIIVYWNFDIVPVNLIERQALIASVYS